MTLLTRINRLFQADMHAVLDKIEEPEMLLKQSIREMAESIARQEQLLRLAEHERQQLGSKQQQLAETLNELETKLTLCLQSDKDDLARVLIKRKLETRQAQTLVAEKLLTLNEKFSRSAQQLHEQQAQLTGMQQKAEAFLGKDKFIAGDWQNPAFSIRDEDVEVELLAEKQKWSGL
jgi:phage shock protein A